MTNNIETRSFDYEDFIQRMEQITQEVKLHAREAEQAAAHAYLTH